jgi:hypothetical protein
MSRLRKFALCVCVCVCVCVLGRSDSMCKCPEVECEMYKGLSADQCDKSIRKKGVSRSENNRLQVRNLGSNPVHRV